MTEEADPSRTVPHPLQDVLVVGVSTQALFDLREENQVFHSQGLEAYRAYQREREDQVLKSGTALPLVRALLAVNASSLPGRLVEVVVLSRNDADSAVRVLKTIETLDLDITMGSYRGGADPVALLRAYRTNLFLTAEPDDAEAAIRAGFPAGLIMEPPDVDGAEEDGICIAFDGDAVLFSDESEMIWQHEGRDAFFANESRLAQIPMEPGPFRPLLETIGRLQENFSEQECPVRVALITARTAPAHMRAINTLRDWNVRVDEVHFLGRIPKAEILEVVKPKIFFDDQLSHLTPARSRTPSARVVAASLGTPSASDSPQLFSDTMVPVATRSPRRKRKVEKAPQVAPPATAAESVDGSVAEAIRETYINSEGRSVDNIAVTKRQVRPRRGK
jgi:5'-nucleotidase